MMLGFRMVCVSSVLLAVTCIGGAPAGEVNREGVQFFETKIRPVLVKRCYKCHSTSAKEVQANLLLDTRQGIRTGGETGPAVVPNDTAKSLLISAIRHESVEMPPDGKLSDAVIADFVRWVEMGAPDPREGSVTAANRVIDIDLGRQFWSFQPLGDYDPPEVRSNAWLRTPVDRFIVARLEKEGLTPSPLADANKLIRRLHFDLIGLPPSPEDVEEWSGRLAGDPGAYTELVDELLASEHHGERWARHWLDVARFGESNGFEQDEDRPGAFHYRDFVIEAFNQDMPYDRFVRLQLAGDFLEPDTPQGRVATAFLVAGVENIVQSEKEFERDRYDKLDEVASTVGTAMLGVTIGCARCHDHKFDPIPQRDYYRFISAFGKTMSVERPISDEQNAPVAYVAVDVGDEVTVSDKKLFRFGTKKENFVLKSDVHFLSRGDVARKQYVVTPSFPQVLMRSRHQARHWQGDTEQAVPPRVALARWITDPEHGAGHLLARVIVNRLWQHHIGKGLVATPSDFGAQGEAPSHPRLLDWLACELIRGGWRLKSIHRLITTSAVYMQTHRHDAEGERIDPQNRLLWRRSLRRLDAETIRDGLLAVSGKLDRQLFGPGSLDDGTPRRSIYLTVKRNKLNPMLQLFDAPDALQGIGTRGRTTVAPQALWMINNPRIHEYASDFASRLDCVAGRDLDDAIQAGVLTALARRASSDELARFQQFVQQQAAAYEDSCGSGQARALALKDFCHLLMCLNEFVYVE